MSHERRRGERRQCSWLVKRLCGARARSASDLRLKLEKAPADHATRYLLAQVTLRVAGSKRPCKEVAGSKSLGCHSKSYLQPWASSSWQGRGQEEGW